MPYVCLELPIGLSNDAVMSIRKKVRTSVHKHLATKETKYDYIVVHQVAVDVDGVGAGVTVDLRPGRSEFQKQGFADEVCEALRHCASIESEAVYILFREIVAANHYCGGKPISEYGPPERRGL
jgi:phenylpyruvate tautomerase PptA (4-oxalocrotonate tautomerase family)